MKILNQSLTYAPTDDALISGKYPSMVIYSILNLNEHAVYLETI